MNESLLIWGISLLAIAALLLVIEVFVPSGGIIATASIGCAIAGNICLWRYDAVWGVIGTVGSLIAGPLIFVQTIKIWEHTPTGRKLLGQPTEEDRQKQRLEEESKAKELLALVGMEGEVVTDLRPVGVVRISGKRYDALSETMYIPAGTKVRVTVAEASQIKVRPVG
jgi:membrane-bound ClpP family serine protease